MVRRRPDRSRPARRRRLIAASRRGIRTQPIRARLSRSRVARGNALRVRKIMARRLLPEIRRIVNSFRHGGMQRFARRYVSHRRRKNMRQYIAGWKAMRTAARSAWRNR